MHWNIPFSILNLFPKSTPASKPPLALQVPSGKGVDRLLRHKFFHQKTPLEMKGVFDIVFSITNVFSLFGRKSVVNFTLEIL